MQDAARNQRLSSDTYQVVQLLCTHVHVGLMLCTHVGLMLCLPQLSCIYCIF